MIIMVAAMVTAVMAFMVFAVIVVVTVVMAVVMAFMMFAVIVMMAASMMVITVVISCEGVKHMMYRVSVASRCRSRDNQRSSCGSNNEY